MPKHIKANLLINPFTGNPVIIRNEQNEKIVPNYSSLRKLNCIMVKTTSKKLAPSTPSWLGEVVSHGQSCTIKSTPFKDRVTKMWFYQLEFYFKDGDGFYLPGGEALDIDFLYRYKPRLVWEITNMDHIIKSLSEDPQPPNYLYIESKSDTFDIHKGWEFSNEFKDKLKGFSLERERWLTRNIGNESNTYFGRWA